MDRLQRNLEILAPFQRLLDEGRAELAGPVNTDFDDGLKTLAQGVIERHTRPARPVWPVAVGLVGAVAAFVMLVSGVV